MYTRDMAAKQKPPLAMRLDGKRSYPPPSAPKRARRLSPVDPFGLLLLVTQRLELLLALVLGDLLAPFLLQVAHDSPLLFALYVDKCRSII